jgi:hypothetical protein
MVYQWAVASRCEPTPNYRTVSEQVREVRYIDTTGFAAVRLITVGRLVKRIFPADGWADLWHDLDRAKSVAV